MVLSLGRCFLGGSDGKESVCSGGELGLTPGLRWSPGVGNGYPSSIPSWRIPWTRDPGGLQSTGLQRIEHYWAINTSLGRVGLWGGLFFCLHLLAFPAEDASFFSSKSGVDIWGKPKKPLTLSSFLRYKVPAGLPLTLHLSKSSCLFYL